MGYEYLFIAYYFWSTWSTHIYGPYFKVCFRLSVLSI